MMIREGRLERLLLLPLSIGCGSDSSVALATAPTPQYSETTRAKRGAEKSPKLKIKNKQCLFKASFTKGLQRLIYRIKSFSHFFAFKGKAEQTKEKEMEIGFPTDVKHVTHIGLDGSTKLNPVPNWENLKPSETLSFPSITLQQFELAMAAQSHAPHN